MYTPKYKIINKRLKLYYIDAQPFLFRKVNEIEDLKQENYTLHEENREIARKLMAVKRREEFSQNVESELIKKHNACEILQT